jgi:hypothetical protein
MYRCKPKTFVKCYWHLMTMCALSLLK